MNLAEEIKRNYDLIQEQVQKTMAASRAIGDQVQVIVVSKKKNADVVRAAMQAGIDTFGENYAEEAAAKIEELGHASAL